MAARLAGISIKNFKAVGHEMLRLRLAPVTLLFGPNGAGKSTILHALHYVREVLHGRLDVDRTERGGSLDLGGFRNLLHQRDLEREMVIGFELELGGTGLPSPGGLFDAEFLFTRNLDEAVRASVELTLRWSSVLGRPIVQRYRVGLDSVEFASVVASFDLADIVFTDWNLQHPALRVAYEDADEVSRADMDFVGSDGWEAPFEPYVYQQRTSEGEPIARAPLKQINGAIPPLDRLLGLDVAPCEIAVQPFDRQDDEERDGLAGARAINRYLSRIMVGAGIALRGALDDLIHIGPLRAVPPRGYRAQATPDPARWIDGMAGWDRLLAMSPAEVARVDGWLAGEEQLRSGFGVKVSRSVQIPSGHPLNALVAEATALDLDDLRSLWEDLQEERRVVLVDTARGIDVEPGDIGVGVSQVLPVVVAALDKSLRLVAVEQPELHVHPRLQVVLGDLFADGVRPTGEQSLLFSDMTATTMANGRTFLVETHSEHLLLRLLRRIREASEGARDLQAPPVSPATISVNYLLPHAEGVRLMPLRVDETGEFVERWPEGFFDEREEELF